MSAVRRAALTVGLALALALTLALTATPAQAAFDDTATTAAPTVTTVTVQPATALSTAGSVCTPDGLELHLSWTPSSTSRVASYRVQATTFFGLITVPIGTTSATTTRIVADLPRNSLGYSFSLTTVTDYGWTAQSAQTGTIRC